MSTKPSVKPTAKAGANPATGNKTTVALRADVDIDNKPVAVEGVFGDSFFLQLNREAKLGSPVTFGMWLNTSFKTQVGLLGPIKNGSVEYTATDFTAAIQKPTADPEKVAALTAVKTHLKDVAKVPDSMVEMLTTALTADLILTDLLIDQKKVEGKEVNKYKFGIAIQFNSDMELLPSMKLKKISLLITSTPADDTNPPERTEIPALPSYASGTITFADQPADQSTITLGKTIWTFTAGAETGETTKIEATLQETIKKLVDGLTASANADIAQFSYEAGGAGTVLAIKAKVVGAAGNDLAIAASAESKGIASGEQLAGG